MPGVEDVQHAKADEKLASCSLHRCLRCLRLARRALRSASGRSCRFSGGGGTPAFVLSKSGGSGSSLGCGTPKPTGIPPNITPSARMLRAKLARRVFTVTPLSARRRRPGEQSAARCLASLHARISRRSRCPGQRSSFSETGAAGSCRNSRTALSVCCASCSLLPGVLKRPVDAAPIGPLGSRPAALPRFRFFSHDRGGGIGTAAPADAPIHRRHLYASAHHRRSSLSFSRARRAASAARCSSAGSDVVAWRMHRGWPATLIRACLSQNAHGTTLPLPSWGSPMNALTAWASCSEGRAGACPSRRRTLGRAGPSGVGLHRDRARAAGESAADVSCALPSASSPAFNAMMALGPDRDC